MNVMSLFDNFSGIRLAFERANIKIDNFYSSEINKQAIKISNKHYDDIIRLEDIRTIDFKDFQHKIDIIVGNPPYNMLRQLNNNYENNLFTIFLNAIKIIKPKYFILENGTNVGIKAINYINEELNVFPITIDHSLLSAQNKKRLYWTNIKNITEPNNKYIALQDILEFDIDKRQKSSPVRMGNINIVLNNQKVPWDTVTDEKRRLTIIEKERLQTLPDNYTEGVSLNNRHKIVGCSYTIDVMAHILSFLPQEYKNK